MLESMGRSNCELFCVTVSSASSIEVDGCSNDYTDIRVTSNDYLCVKVYRLNVFELFYRVMLLISLYNKR